MKFLLFSDLHFCEYSSILRKEGSKYSIRLEKLIETLNWIEKIAVEQCCDRVISFGDFFDKPILNSREITALNDVNWSNIYHQFIIGNHEASNKSLKYNSTNVLKKLNFEIIDSIMVEDFDTYMILYLPYISDIEKEHNLNDYFEKLQIDKNIKKLIFSHNDVKGIQYGAFLSEIGIAIDDIDSTCDIFLNGHLHNSVKFSKKGFNLGNVSGQNFSEDAFTYMHCAYILDTDNLSLEAIPNPYALNFYKINIQNELDLAIINNLKENSVISVKCVDNLLENVKQAIFENRNILESRINIIYEKVKNDKINESSDITITKIDYLDKFSNFCFENFENTELLKQELSIICK